MKQKKWYSLVPVMAVIAIFLVPTAVSAQSEVDIKAMMANVNDQLAAMGENVRMETFEYYTSEDAAEAGRIVYFSDRTHQLPTHWVPYDPERGGYREIFWLSDLTEGTANGVTFEQTQTAVSAAMAAWNGVTCANIPLVQLPDYGIDWGYIQWMYGFGGFPGWFADITHAGWLPGAFFEAIGGPGASDSIIGVTYTFIWIDDTTGEPTDMDNNGKRDVAFKEIYYNNKFPWGMGTNWPIDVKTVVMHEVGHGLSLAHFGDAFRTVNGKLHFAPLALMNAGYSGVQGISGTDNASFCSIWATWPIH
jgi:hypothetical protein